MPRMVLAVSTAARRGQGHHPIIRLRPESRASAARPRTVELLPRRDRWDLQARIPRRDPPAADARIVFHGEKAKKSRRKFYSFISKISRKKPLVSVEADMPNVKTGCPAFASNENEKNGQHSVSNEMTVAAKSRFSEERGTLNTYPSSVDFTSDALSLSTWRTLIFLSSSPFSSKEHDGVFIGFMPCAAAE